MLAAGALAGFAVSVGASLYVLLPRDNVVFSLKGSRAYEELFEHAGAPSEVHRRLTYELDRFWDANNPQLDSLRSWFRVAVVGLGAEVALLLISVGGTLV